MPQNTTFVTKRGNRTVTIGLVMIVVILALTGAALLYTLPDANAFNDQVARIFAQNDALTNGADIKLLEILAQSGTTFADTLRSYRVVILVLLAFSTAILIAALVFLAYITTMNRRLSEIERSGIQINSLILSRDELKVYINNMEFTLTEAATEALAVLCEARLDGEFISGADLESTISGKPAADCDEAAGATRIKRLRDHLGNQIVSELLIKTISRKGYMLGIDKDVIRLI